MSEIVEFYTAALPKGPHSETRLIEEIAYLESRLLQNDFADCAYERSLARSYQALLEARRGQLAELRSA